MAFYGGGGSGGSTSAGAEYADVEWTYESGTIAVERPKTKIEIAKGIFQAVSQKIDAFGGHKFTDTSGVEYFYTRLEAQQIAEESPMAVKEPDGTGLVFNSGLHEYKYDGVVVPSVTQIINDHMGITLDFVKQRDLDRGTAVHKAIELYIAGTLDESSVMSELQPYLDAYKKWVKMRQFEASESELRVCNLMHKYAGTIDILGHMKEHGNELCLIEIKTGATRRYQRLQTAGYAMAYTGEPEKIHRYCVHLDKTGEHRTYHQNEAEDFDAFKALLNAREVNLNYGGRIK